MVSRHYQAWSLALAAALLIYREQQAFNVIYELMFEESLAIIRDFYSNLGVGVTASNQKGKINLDFVSS